MRLLNFIVGLVSLISITNGVELLVYSTNQIDGSIPLVEYKGKYISLIESDSVFAKDFNDDDIIEENAVVSLDTNYTQIVGTSLWNLDSLDGSVDRAYNYFYTGNNVSVYVIDSGITKTPEFDNRLQDGTSFNPYGSLTTDCLGHGTHVASIIGSRTYGVAKNVKIIPVKIFDCANSAMTSIVLQGIYWVIKQPKGIVNLSIGGGYNNIMNIAIKDLVDAGFIVVVAAGNNGGNACNYSPSSEKSGIVVGSSNVNNGISGFSNEGTCVTLFAPGESILALSNTVGRTSIKSGTSMATPHVVGVAATIYEKYPGINQNTMKSLITELAINNSLNNFKIPISPNLKLIGFKSITPKKCHTITDISMCINTPLCANVPKYGCRIYNFCGFKTRRECLTRNRCKYVSNRCRLK
jgi:subtilisin family serine protease